MAGKTNGRSAADTSENNAITASVAGLSFHEVGTGSNVKKNAATHAFENIGVMYFLRHVSNAETLNKTASRWLKAQCSSYLYL